MFLNALMVLYISVTGGQDVRGRGLVVGLVRIRALQTVNADPPELFPLYKLSSVGAAL